MIVYANIFGNKAKKCLVCGLVVHRFCLKLKGTKGINCKVPCAPQTMTVAKKERQHQWARRKLDQETRCSACGQFCNNLAHYFNYTCLWCGATRHNYCKDDSPCNFGRFAQSTILPEEVFPISDTKNQENGRVEIRLSKPKSIPVFIINKLSGPQFGEKTLEFLYANLNPIQVIDLLDEGIERLKLFKNLPDLKVIIGGGDGTMGGLVDSIYDILGRNITLIPMPLGTGNDLSRALGWGEGISTTKDVRYYLKYLETKPLPTLFDRWLVKITSKKNPGKVLHELKLLLYFGIGLDGKFSYQFNLIRKKFPYFFKTRVQLNLLRLVTSFSTVKWARTIL